MTIGVLYFKDATVYRAQKALVAAKFNGLQVELRAFTDADASKKEFYTANPTGVVPYLDTGCGCISGSNAVARYVARTRADTNLCGSSFDEEGVVDTWLEFCIYELEVPLMTWVYPCMGLMADTPKTPGAKEDVKLALTQLEATLGKCTYLLGDKPSLADIAIVCALKEGFARVFDPAFRKPFAKVTAWFERCCALPQFKAVLGDVKLCAQAEKPKPYTAPKGGKVSAQAASPKQSAKAKAKASPLAAGGGDAAAQIKIVEEEMRALKQKLKGEGVPDKKLDDHPEVELRAKYLRLFQMALAEQQSVQTEAAATASPKKIALPKTSPKRAPKKSPAKGPAAAPATGGGSEADIKAVGDEIRVLKEKLKSEGLSGKKVNDHTDVKALVEKLSALKAGGAPAPAPAAKAKASPKKSPKKSPKAAPKAASAAVGDAEAQVKAVGDDIRTLKEKLKAEGLSGKKVNEHAEIKALVAKLTELKAQL